MIILTFTFFLKTSIVDPETKKQKSAVDFYFVQEVF
jgi:hypothetical protein